MLTLLLLLLLVPLACSFFIQTIVASCSEPEHYRLWQIVFSFSHTFDVHPLTFDLFNLPFSLWQYRLRYLVHSHVSLHSNASPLNLSHNLGINLVFWPSSITFFTSACRMRGEGEEGPTDGREAHEEMSLCGEAQDLFTRLLIMINYA